MVGGAEGLDPGQQRAAVSRQHHAATVAAEQRDSQLVLQRLDGVATPDWVKFSSSAAPGEAAALPRS